MSIQNAILKTLAYHDIFDYPLKQDEIYFYLISSNATHHQIKNVLTSLVKEKKIGLRHGEYFLKARISLVEVREKRAKFAQEKMKKAKLFANLLKIIPTIKFVAISGGLAVENSEKKDDIDLVIVTKKRSLWTTRLVANLLLMPFKRNPRSKNTKDKACLNLFIDESDLKIDPESLYTAHEVSQMKVLWDRGGVYKRFLKVNAWIYNYLPNWKPEKVQSGRSKKDLSLITNHLSLVESFLKNFQLWYMRSKVTTEKIGETQLFFHPRETEKWVLREYAKRLQKLNLSE